MYPHGVAGKDVRQIFFQLLLPNTLQNHSHVHLQTERRGAQRLSYQMRDLSRGVYHEGQNA
jgi:hypothetical protein